MTYILGIDLGTTYFKAALYMPDGRLVGLTRVAVNPSIDGVRCELEVSRFISLLNGAIAEVCHQAGSGSDDIVAVSYASQANSFVLLNKALHPLTPIVLWPDDRAAVLDRTLEGFVNKSDFLMTTGLGLFSHQFCLNKLVWFRQNEPDIWNRADCVMTLSDFFTFMCTGERAGDAGTASLLGLLDLKSCSWWQRALDCLGIEKQSLSVVKKPGSMTGKTRSNPLGIPRNIPFIAGGLDHHIAAIGAGVKDHHRCSESTGTVLACFRYLDRYQPKKNCHTGPATDGLTCYQLAFRENGTRALDYYLKTVMPQQSFKDLFELAGAVEPGCDGLVAIWQNQTNRFSKGQGDYTPGHYVRSVLESTALDFVELIALLFDRTLPADVLATGGGAKSDLWLQIKADMLGVPVIRSGCEEPASRGAAMLAAVGYGCYPSLKACSEEWPDQQSVFYPDKKNVEKYHRWIKKNRSRLMT
ncbi:hypothetical protein GF407_08985 [candidate division KSB1 bacterium]|nr:hypothetical protein [candidate division KSB1 bacterium]